MGLHNKLLYLYPDYSGEDWLVAATRNKEWIEEWNRPEEKPTQAELDAVDDVEADAFAAKLSKRQSAKLPRHEFIYRLKHTPHGNSNLFAAAKQYANNAVDDYFLIALDEAPEFSRTSEKLNQAARDMGVSEEQLDTLFGIK